ncbi:MAG: hypothetical protein NC489_17965 [Ruminococcus flavefaciens]|nr:hypothetical protein [Ruminococcus flavefaciens]
MIQSSKSSDSQYRAKPIVHEENPKEKLLEEMKKEEEKKKPFTYYDN